MGSWSGSDDSAVFMQTSHLAIASWQRVCRAAQPVKDGLRPPRSGERVPRSSLTVQGSGPAKLGCQGGMAKSATAPRHCEDGERSEAGRSNPGLLERRVGLRPPRDDG
jgi:hypothetical protein